MLDSQLEGLEENINITVMEEGTSSQRIGTFTNKSHRQCFNVCTITDDEVFEDNSILNVMVSSVQPRVMIENDHIQITIQDDDGMEHAIYICM